CLVAFCGGSNPTPGPSPQMGRGVYLLNNQIVKRVYKPPSPQMGRGVCLLNNQIVKRVYKPPSPFGGRGRGWGYSRRKTPPNTHYTQNRKMLKACFLLLLLPVLATAQHPLPVADTLSGFAFVPGGTFQMGDTYNEDNGDGKPVHEVAVSGFYLGKTEVTFEEYDAYCTATGREKPDDEGWGRGQRPVINVDWYDAVEYCNWRSKEDKLQLVYTIDRTRIDPNNPNHYDKKGGSSVLWNISTLDIRCSIFDIPRRFFLLKMSNIEHRISNIEV
ncbi:MAG: formylglycine-generating enzyme family protein, partial [Saprospiraceae bacterium]|nr:formylglycine-generating enzyme family protein [Saprospiraceae bacterium]